MLLKSLWYKVRWHDDFPEEERENTLQAIDMIMYYAFNDPEVWPWKNFDHRTLICHYPEITGRIIGKNPNGADFLRAHAVLMDAGLFR